MSVLCMLFDPNESKSLFFTISSLACMCEYLGNGSKNGAIKLRFVALQVMKELSWL